MKSILKQTKWITFLPFVLLIIIVTTVILSTPVSAEELKYEVEGGYIYFDAGTNSIINCDKSVTNVSIPSKIKGIDVTRIGRGAFSDCIFLTSIIIPDNITTIEPYAFNRCVSLESITIINPSVRMDSDSFNNCDSLKSANIPYSRINYFKQCPNITLQHGVTTIKQDAFYGFTALESITFPDSVTSIEDFAFYGCTSLKSILLPSSIKGVGSNAFTKCTSLKSIIVDENNKIYADIDGVLFTKDKSTLIYCPEGKEGSFVIPDNVTNIWDGAFHDCSLIREISIPNSVTSIGTLTFGECTSLSSVKIPNTITSIGAIAFRNCTSLTSIIIPDSVTSIGGGAFYGCTALASITIPNSVATIKHEAFYGCTALASIIIPDSVTSLGNYAFYGCTALASITIPDSVTSLGNYAFYGCTALASVTISNNITLIDDYTFTDCKSLISITIPHRVTLIGEGVFYDCSALKSITIPNSVKKIQNQAFYNCSNLENIYYNSSEQEWNQIEKSEYSLTESNKAIFLAIKTYNYPCGVDGHIFSDWMITIEPTTMSNGELSRKCENCGATETEEIAQLETTSNPFNDVKEAQWYTEGVLWCYHSGYMAGVSDTDFGRKQNVTRAMFATILAKIDGDVIPKYTAEEMSFSDVQAGKWYSNAIEWAYRNNYASGIGFGLFGKNMDITRETLAQFFYTYSSLNNIDVSDRTDLSMFTDLGKVHDWALKAVKWAVAKGLISGTTETTLSPRDSASRAEIAIIIKNYVENVKG